MANLTYRYRYPDTAAAQRARAILKRLEDVPGPTVAEIGVFTGDLSIILLAARPDLRLLMVDPYETYEQTEDYKASGDFHTTMTADQHKWARKMASKGTDFAWYRREQAVMTSLQAAEEYERIFDLVFIDGDHSYKGCREDIDAWRPLVKEGGWLSGHDYRTDMPGFGVKDAVDATFTHFELDANYTWFVRL